MENLLRKDVLKKFIDHDIKTIMAENEKGTNRYIKEILTIGFKGYDYYTNKELAEEHKAVFGTEIWVD